MSKDYILLCLFFVIMKLFFSKKVKEGVNLSGCMKASDENYRQEALTSNVEESSENGVRW